MKRVVFFVGVSLIAGVLGVKAQNNVKSSDFVRTPDSLLKLWEEEHGQMLENEAPPQFNVLHYVAMAELTLKDVK